MFATRLCRVPLTAFVTTISKPTPLKVPGQIVRFQNNVSRPLRRVRNATLKEQLTAPAGETAFSLGRGVLAGASALGLGALCYYGLGLSNEVGTVDKAIMWPPVVRRRIRDTYMYFGGGILLTAASAVAVARNPTLMRLAMKNSWMAIGATFAAMIGTGMVARSIPYQEGFGTKQLAWMLHVGVMGGVIAPITMLGGAILIRAAWYTAAVVGGLSALAVCAPSEKFLNMGAPLAMGLGAVVASSIGSMFLPPTTAIGAGLYSISMYGGLVLFGAFLLFDTQRIIKHAETYPLYAIQPFDPVNASIGIYLDAINIFIRIAMLLGGGGGRRK